MRVTWLARAAAVAALAAALAAAAPEVPSLDTLLDGVARVTRPGGEVLESRASGHANVQYAAPMSPTAEFPIGSNTKLFTTVALYQLQEAGKVNLSSNVADLLDATDFAAFGLPNVSSWCPSLPATPNKCEAITFHQLLAMSSGLYPALNCDAQPTSACRMADFVVSPGTLGRVVGSFLLNPLIFAPGTAYHYANPNFVLSAYFVEKLSGQKFGAYLRQHVFAPLGLQATSYDWFNGQLRHNPRRVHEFYKFVDNASHELLSYGPSRMQLDLGAASGTGGLVASQQDEEAFYRTLFDRSTGGAPLLKDPASQAAIVRPWNPMHRAPFPNGTAQIYYAQGVGVVCFEKGCPGGWPDYIVYMGGTFASHTANALDTRPGVTHGTMAQVWTCTNLYPTTQAALDEVMAAEEGVAVFTASQWASGAPEQMQLAWQLLFRWEDKQAGEAGDARTAERRAAVRSLRWPGW